MSNRRNILYIPLILMIVLACTLAGPENKADPNAFNTMVALTLQAQMAQPATLPPPPTINQAPSVLPTIPPQQTDENAIKEALLIKLGWSETELELSLTQNDGRIARGSVKRTTEMQGAAWFAGKDANGKWIIAHIGQGVPNCVDIQPFNFPVDWISHCVDSSGQTVERGQPAPAITPTDVFAPNPLGPLFSSMYISAGMCYDMDILFHTTDASCDVYLDSGGLLTPRNGGLFSGYATLTPPSLNACKSAILSADPIAPNTDLYMCFKTNLGKYGFFVARQIETAGIVFDAYVFP